MTADDGPRWCCERCGTSGPAAAPHPLGPPPAGIERAIHYCWLVHLNTCKRRKR
jgi:hypothetical protein